MPRRVPVLLRARGGNIRQVYQFVWLLSVFWDRTRNFELYSYYSTSKQLDVRLNVHQVQVHDGSLMESGFDAVSPWFRSRDLITKPSRTLDKSGKF
ncbi:hypothetical protein AVEN_93817-1 [Araneus ventricosus]|uniref:Uncharacterized protein n=1 Tax=Araneus ventricosus TaxID=182803 RepID=A0A4Y2B0A9_ARAVE|nr:hypothetical protein AVEN_93817-1 [Araneus ventricosus]